MFPSRRAHADAPASIKHHSGALIQLGLRLRRQPSPAPAGGFIVGFAALLILVGVLMQLAVDLEVVTS